MKFNNFLVTDYLINWEKQENIWEVKYLNIPIYCSLRKILLPRFTYKSIKRRVDLKYFIIEILKDLLILIININKLFKIKAFGAVSKRDYNIETTKSRLNNLVAGHSAFYLLCISDLNVKFDSSSENNIIISDKIILLIRVIFYILHLPIYLVILINYKNFINKIINFEKKINNKNILTNIFIHLNVLMSFSDILFSHLFSKLFKIIIISGGSLPHSVTFLNSNNIIEEISHCYIGYGHQLYTHIENYQGTLVNINPKNYSPSNRKVIIDTSSTTKIDCRFNFCTNGKYSYFPSASNYHLNLISKKNYDKINIFQHPKEGFKNTGRYYISRAFCEPGSIIIDLLVSNIPVSIVCTSEEECFVLSYFNVDRSNVNFVNPNKLDSIISELL